MRSWSPLLFTLVSLSLADKWTPSDELRQKIADLTAQESRYKVVAKPVPYKPSKPAPLDLEGIIPAFSTTTTTTEKPTEKSAFKVSGAPNFNSFKPKKYDNADIIYPTTTYRPQKFQLSDLLSNQSPGPSIDKYLPKSTTTTRKPSVINEIPFGVKKQKKRKTISNSKKPRKVVRRVKKTKSKIWRQKQKEQKDRESRAKQKQEQRDRELKRQEQRERELNRQEQRERELRAKQEQREIELLRLQREREQKQQQQQQQQQREREQRKQQQRRR